MEGDTERRADRVFRIVSWFLAAASFLTAAMMLFIGISIANEARQCGIVCSADMYSARCLMFGAAVVGATASAFASYLVRDAKS